MLQRTVPALRYVAPSATQFRPLTKLSAVSLQENPDDKMQAWQIHSYNGLNDLQLSNVRIPVINQPTDVLVKVQAASVNPIDVAMASTSVPVPAFDVAPLKVAQTTLITSI